MRTKVTRTSILRETVRGAKVPLPLSFRTLLLLLFCFTGCKEKSTDQPQPKVEKRGDDKVEVEKGGEPKLPKVENPGKMVVPHETAEVAYRRYLAGLESRKKEQQVATLDAVLPYRKDMDKLFPKFSKRWESLDADRKEDLEDCQEFIEKVINGGAVTNIKMIDIRTGPPEATAPYRLVLSLLDPTAPIVEFEVERKQGRKSIDQGWVYVHQRWIKIDGILRMIRELEAGKD